MWLRISGLTASQSFIAIFVRVVYIKSIIISKWAHLQIYLNIPALGLNPGRTRSSILISVVDIMLLSQAQLAKHSTASCHLGSSISQQLSARLNICYVCCGSVPVVSPISIRIISGAQRTDDKTKNKTIQKNRITFTAIMVCRFI